MKDRPFVVLAKELNYAMSGAHEAPKTETRGPETREQKFTVVVYDEDGRVVLFRQVNGYSAFGVLNQIDGMRASGDTQYGVDTTDFTAQPDFVAVRSLPYVTTPVRSLEITCWEDGCEYTGLPTSVGAHWTSKHARGSEFD